MSIGKWIVVVFILFAGFIGTLVTICVRQDISLVSKEYYKEELAYQEQIKRISNTALLERKPVILITRKAMQVTFDHTQAIEHGELRLYCPSNARMDRTLTLGSNQQEFSQEISGLTAGMYRAKLYWSMSGKDYYLEEIINL